MSTVAMTDPPTPAPAVVRVAMVWQYVAPARRDDPGATMFDVYLEMHCRWSPEDGRDAGIAWLWDQPIPARLDWWNEVDRLNVRLHDLERQEARR